MRVNPLVMVVISGDCWFCNEQLSMNYPGVLMRKHDLTAVTLCTDCMARVVTAHSDYVAENTKPNPQLTLDWLPK